MTGGCGIKQLRVHFIQVNFKRSLVWIAGMCLDHLAVTQRCHFRFGRQCQIPEMSSKCRIGKAKCFEERGLWERRNDPSAISKLAPAAATLCAVKLRISSYN